MTTAIVPYSASTSVVVHGELESAMLVPHLSLREAYARAQPAARALPEELLVPLNIDLPSAVVKATGALLQIMPFRERAAALAEFDITHSTSLKRISKPRASHMPGSARLPRRPRR